MIRICLVLHFQEENIGVDIELEGGVGSPLGGKIVIADVYPGGAVDRSGKIRYSHYYVRSCLFWPVHESFYTQFVASFVTKNS